jgi:hypothetical protein
VPHLAFIALYGAQAPAGMTRRIATHEVDTNAPLADIVATVVRIADAMR